LGFIGSNLTHALLHAGGAVTVVDRLVPTHGGDPAHLDGVDDSSLRQVIGDIADSAVAADVVRGQEYVFNLAAQTSHRDSMLDPVGDLDHNCRPHLVLLEACRAYAPGARIIYSSTRQVYGRVATLPVDETCPTAPCDINAIHKLAAGHYHRLYRTVHGLRTTCLRLTNTYGPRMRVQDGRQNFLGIWIRRLLDGEPFEVWGGLQMRDYTFVGDVVEALLMAAVAPDGGVYNLGGAEVVSHRDLAALCVEANGGGTFRVLPMPAAQAAIDVGDYHGDYSRFRAVTGWEPRTPLADGLRQTFEYFRARDAGLTRVPAAGGGGR
jgi:UDP-glucose 4-epimerase